MPQLPDINPAKIHSDDKDKQIESIVQQVNEWGRLVSNEDRTKIVKSEAGIEALTYGQMPQGGTGILIKDEDDVRRIIIGELPDGTIGIVISKPGYDVVEAFDA